MNIEKKVRGTVAQGWCTKENEHKVMDVDLALAIARALLTSPDLVIMEREKWEKIIGYLTEYEEWFPCLEVEQALGEGKE